APIDHRHRGAQAPMRVEGVIERNDNVAIESRHFVMVATQLAYAHLVAPRARLILVHVLVTQIQPGAGLGPRTLRIPARIDRAESGAARGAGRKGEGEGGQRPGGTAKHLSALRHLSAPWCAREPPCSPGAAGSGRSR